MRLGAPLLAAAMIAASAGSGRAVPPASGPPQRASLFISPAGQPFRAGPGEPYPVARWFAQADRDGDGKLDRAEFMADAIAFFDSLDKNHDGVIDGFELSAYEQDVAPEILGAYRPPPGGQRMRGGQGGAKKRDRKAAAGDEEVLGGAAPYELIPLPEPVAAADVNLTGQVTLADFTAAMKRRFDQLDTKGAGYLTLADLPKTPTQQQMIKAAAENHAERP
jgi:Ca2+-binding EF-hand superfamily protein